MGQACSACGRGSKEETFDAIPREAERAKADAIEVAREGQRTSMAQRNSTAAPAATGGGGQRGSHEPLSAPKGSNSRSKHHSDIGAKGSAFTAGFVHARSIKDLMKLYDTEAGMTLGQGAFGSVIAIKRHEDGEQFALKVIKIGHGDTVDPLLEEVRTEIDIQKRLDHPNIAKIIESYEDLANNQIYIVMEICTGGNLVSRMKTHRAGYSEAAAATYIEKMLSSVLYCHNHGVVHRDIKLENMIFQNAGDDAELKLIDFGFASLVRPGKERMYEQMGTPSYMAPELYERDESKACYTSAVDIWAIGVCAYMLLTGVKPFYHRDQETRRWQIRHKHLEFRSPQCDHLSREAKDFCHFLLQKKPQARPSASEAIAHPWIQQRSTLHSGADAAHELAAHGEVVDALVEFAEAEDLKRLALEVIAFNTPPARLEELRELFHKMDTDDSGTLSLDEFKEAMKLHPELSDRRVTQIFQQMDLTNAGEVDYTEFLAATISSQESRESHAVDAPSISAAFHTIDTDHDGFITRDDLAHAFAGQLEEEAMQRMLSRVNGRCNLEQFQQMMLAEHRVSGEMTDVLRRKALAHSTAMAAKFDSAFVRKAESAPSLPL